MPLNSMECTYLFLSNSTLTRQMTVVMLLNHPFSLDDSICKLNSAIGVARECNGCMCTPRVRKRFFGVILGVTRSQ